MLFNLVLILIILFLLMLLSMVWPPDSPWAPWWRTSKKTARAMCKLAKVKKGDIIYDLGSGDGTALMIASKEFQARGVGIEIDPVRYFTSILLLKINGVLDRVKLVRGNFFEQNLQKADVVFGFTSYSPIDIE
ncbi:MAG: hypothetical protein AABY22_02465, partial [Nanoarchaeota archaeon]